MENQNIKAVIYDGDGMVISSETYYLALLREFGSRAESLNDFFANEFQQCLIGDGDLKEEIKPYLQKLGWKKGEEAFIEHWFESESKSDADIIDSIKKIKLKGIKCYLASNQEKYRTDYVMKNMGLADVFDKIFFSSRVGYLKPQREFFEYIERELAAEELDKHDALFWDDRGKNVELANDYGFNAELYRNFEGYVQIMKKYKLL